MRKIRIYIDTSVFGGIDDEEFADSSRLFFQQTISENITILVSTELLRELEAAPTSIKAILENIPNDLLEGILVDSEVELLADAYIAAGILGHSSRSDAIHVAAATVGEADLIVSWNFKHIVNFNRIQKYNAINLLKGYGAIEIRSPMEISYDEET